ncbi:MAG: TetR family transcriptional regulator [Mycobacterium sp.]|nr:TetR family transcriptional regulator [Mycobacterium sp.]
MTRVTAAVTPKGERRRSALVRAAAELLCEGGFEAVTHRAVAERAGLPLASTTYYFSSLEELIETAVEYLGTAEVAQLRDRVKALPRRRRGAEAAADLLVDLLAGEPNREQLISRYERYIACARNPAMRGVERRLLKQRVAAVGEAMARSGRRVRPDMMTALLYSVDGAVVSALVDDQDGPRESVRATLVDVIDVLAPIDQPIDQSI